MRLDVGDDLLHALHDFGEVDLGLGLADAEFLRAGHVRQQLGRAQHGLGGHTAVVQTIATHFVLLDERDLGSCDRANVGTDQARCAPTDHDKIAVVAPRPLPALVNAPGLDPVHDFFGDEREDTQQHKRADESWRSDIPQAGDLRQLRTGVHVDHRAGQHPRPTDYGKGHRLDRREPHGQVDDEKRKCRHQAQAEQVEGPIFLDAAVNGLQPLAVLGLHGVA